MTGTVAAPAGQDRDLLAAPLGLESLDCDDDCQMVGAAARDGGRGRPSAGQAGLATETFQVETGLRPCNKNKINLKPETTFVPKQPKIDQFKAVVGIGTSACNVR